MKRLVVIGLVGTQLDAGKGPRRWERWRPTISVGSHEELLVDRLELLHGLSASKLARTLSQDFASVSPETEVRTHRIEWSDPWDFEEVYGTLFDFARSYPFDPDEEDYLVHITTGTHVAQICFFLLTESRHIPARLLQTSPPSKKDLQRETFTVIDLDLSRYDRIASRFREQHDDSVSFLKSGIETRNADFNRLIDRIERVAGSSPHPLLLMGPTGAGKSRLARRIYELKKQRGLLTGAFVEVNCATLRGDRAAAALFGHTRGAFTGAQTARDGLLRAADGGTLFLDEIGELGADEQAMLLRAIEEKTFLPLGADRPATSDFQLIAGTNRDLEIAVREGRFRDDLLARINLWTFRLPSLRDRREDIAPNLNYELAAWGHSTGQHVTMNKQARARFLRFAESPEATWAGNFRDLNAAVVRMATLAAGGRITVELVDEEIARLASSWARLEGHAADLVTEVLGDIELDRFDRVQLAEVIRVCRRARSLSEAGRTLFAVSLAARKSRNDADRLRKYLARFGLAFDDVRGRFTQRAQKRQRFAK